MINTIRSEWIKLRTVRMNLVLFIIAVAFPVIVSILVASLGDVTDLKVSDVAGLVKFKIHCWAGQHPKLGGILAEDATEDFVGWWGRQSSKARLG